MADYFEVHINGLRPRSRAVLYLNSAMNIAKSYELGPLDQFRDIIVDSVSKAPEVELDSLLERLSGLLSGDEDDAVHIDFLSCVQCGFDELNFAEPTSGGAWYILEPVFQEVSERLYGVIDLGSDRESEKRVVESERVVEFSRALLDAIANLDDRSSDDLSESIENPSFELPY